MIDEKILIEKLESLKETLVNKMGNSRHLNKAATIKLFDNIIEKITIMSDGATPESWYVGHPNDMVRLSYGGHEDHDFIVDYDKCRGMYRVSYFKDNHFEDECWFDAYEEKELDKSFPLTIGKITFYSQADLFQWVKEQQKINELETRLSGAVMDHLKQRQILIDRMNTFRITEANSEKME